LVGLQRLQKAHIGVALESAGDGKVLNGLLGYAPVCVRGGEYHFDIDVIEVQCLVLCRIDYEVAVAKVRVRSQNLRPSGNLGIGQALR
jgi:hypothetical protein